ncbi:MAG: hypothetical protein ACI9GW_000213 [Halieaceae bacterium]|jgi:hypothetical protein
MIRTLLISLSLLALTACSTTDYNATVYPFSIDTELLAASPIKRVIIADVNLGIPSRQYLRSSEGTVDGMLSAYLRENGYQIESSRKFTQAWKVASRINGNPFDPSTGKVNQKTFALNIISVAKELAETSKVDAIIFTDLVERDVQFSGGLSHLARWDGVSRKPTLRGPGDGVSANFDWSKSASAASLWVSVYNLDLQRVFTSIGGLDTTDAIDTKSSTAHFTRRRTVLENGSNLREGVALAMHPFIPMEKYPGEATP